MTTSHDLLTRIRTVVAKVKASVASHLGSVVLDVWSLTGQRDEPGTVADRPVLSDIHAVVLPPPSTSQIFVPNFYRTKRQ